MPSKGGWIQTVSLSGIQSSQRDQLCRNKFQHRVASVLWGAEPKGTEGLKKGVDSEDWPAGEGKRKLEDESFLCLTGHLWVPRCHHHNCRLTLEAQHSCCGRGSGVEAGEGSPGLFQPSPLSRSSLSLKQYLYTSLPISIRLWSFIQPVFFCIIPKGHCQNYISSINMKPRVYFTETHSRLSSLESFSIMWAWLAYKHMSGPFLHLIFKTSLGSIFYIVWLIVGITENHLVNIHSYWMSTICQVLASWASWNIHSMNGRLANEGHMNLTWVSISMSDY